MRLREGLPLAPNEERYVLADAMASETFGNPWAIRIKGPLDKARLRDAILKMCDRHEGRRTGYELGPDGRFTRFVEAKARPDIRCVTMIGASAAQARQTIRDWFFERGDLSPPSLSRYLILQTGDDEHILGHLLHHAVNDAETHRLATAEVIDNYAGREPAGPAIAYSDLWEGDWRSSQAYLDGEAFWRTFLADVEDVGELPADGGDPPGGEWTGPARVRLPPELVAAAAGAAKAAGVSEFAFHYAVTLVLLTRLAGAERVCSTFQSGGRRGVPGSEGVHGVFSNGLLLATRVDEQGSIAALAGRLRGEIRQAIAHEAYPYHHVIQASGLKPRFGVNWFPEIALPQCPGLEIFQPDMDFGTSEYDLNIRFVRHLASGGLDVIVYFREPKISRRRAVAAAEQYARLLDVFARDLEAPIADVRSADLAAAGSPPGPRAALPSEGGELIHARFLGHAARRPEAGAIEHDGQRFTYGDIERRSRALAAGLAAAGVAPGDRVAILAERGPALVWSMLAAARLGAVFVVLDAAYPEHRLDRLLEMSGAKALARAGAEPGLARRLAGPRGLPVVDAQAADDADGVVLAALDEAAVERPAYYLFTSGSTGEPKGVACSHVPLTHFVDWQARTYGLEAGDRFTLLSGLSHDPMLRDVFTPLSLGATLLIPRRDQITEPGALGAWLRRSAATVVHATPALGQLMTAAVRPATLPRLRRIFWGGDLLPPSLVREVAALAPAARQVNFYGSTETPQAVAAFDCGDDPGRASVPIGRGVEGSQLLIVDRRGAPVGPGEVGEIAVRSAYPSLGYLGDGAIVPFPSRDGEAADGAGLYFTGDRGFSLPGGEVLMLGRADDQVKVRGHRVELAEVAAALTAHPAVRAAVVLPVGEGPAVRLAGFVTRARRRAPRAAELTQHLAARLPGYMLPATIQVLGALPLLANGKVDRAALRALCAAAPTDADPAQADARRGSARELALIAAWEGVLGEPGISRDSSFVSLGGDSLSYVQTYLATEEVIGAAPSGWQAMTIAELASQERVVSPVWSVVDTPILIRAISIALVVAGHMHLVRYGGGATTGLLVVSGYLFGGLQLREAFKQESAEPILRGLRKLLAPVLLFTAALFAAKALAGRNPNLSILLFLDNFQDYSRLPAEHRDGHAFYLWYIDCLVQMVALLWLTVLALVRLRGFAMDRVRFTLGLFHAACVTRFLAPALFIPGFLTHGPRHLSTVSFLPTTHLATFLLGALIAEAQTRRRQAWVLAALAAYAAATAQVFGSHQAAVVAGAGLLILFLQRIVLPRPLTAAVLLLSGASLFIYLTEFVPQAALKVLHAPSSPALDTAAGLALGVGAWWAWTWTAARLARWTRSPRDAEPQAAL